NIPFLRRVLAHPDLLAGTVHTRWIDDHLTELAATELEQEATVLATAGRAGAAINRNDPLAALDFYRSGTGTRSVAQPARSAAGPPNTSPVRAPLQGTVIVIEVAEGDVVRKGQQLFVMSALKMEHVIKADAGGAVRRVTVAVGDTVLEGEPLAFVEAMDVGDGIVEAPPEIDPDYIRPSLQALFDRREFLL